MCFLYSVSSIGLIYILMKLWNIFYLYFVCHKLMIVQIICAIICYSCYLIIFCFSPVCVKHWSSRFSLFSQMVFVSKLPNNKIIKNYLYLNSCQNRMGEHLDWKLNLGQKWFSQNNPGPVCHFVGNLASPSLMKAEIDAINSCILPVISAADCNGKCMVYGLLRWGSETFTPAGSTSACFTGRLSKLWSLVLEGKFLKSDIQGRIILDVSCNGIILVIKNWIIG